MGGKSGAGAGAGVGAGAGLALHTIKASYDTAVRGEQDQTLGIVKFISPKKLVCRSVVATRDKSDGRLHPVVTNTSIAKIQRFCK